MTNLMIEKTDITPEVHLDASVNEISLVGICLPENAREFFEPIMKWLENLLLEKAAEVTAQINLHYFNSSTSKQLLKLFYRLEDAADENVNVRINWFHAKDDYMILEKGQEFSQMTALDFNFKIIQVD